MGCENNKNVSTYTRSEIIDHIARVCRVDKKTVRDIYNELDVFIVSCLSRADDDKDVVIRLFDGISLNSTYVPEHDCLNNLTGKMIKSSSKIVPKVNLTRNYKDKVTRIGMDNRI